MPTPHGRWGLLFEDREHLVQALHQSLREFLLDASRSGDHAVDVASAHVLLAQSCVQIGPRPPGAVNLP